MDKNNTVEIEIQENGPIKIKGEFTFKDSSGIVTRGYREVLICRCGGSKNKPFCDDTHKKTGVRN